MLDSDVTHPNQRLWVQFFPGKLENEARSRETGKPEFDLVDFIKIGAPGDALNIVVRPIRESDKYEWPQQWAAYSSNQKFRPIGGTPLEDWPRLDVATVAKLQAMEFHTVEQIAEASDAQILNIGMGCYELRDRAIAYLKSAKDSAFSQKLADESRIKDQQIADQNALIKQLADRLEAIEKQPKKPKREAAES